jgi:hypothetical protein
VVFTLTLFAAIGLTLKYTVAKNFLKLMVLVMCLQASWLQAFSHTEPNLTDRPVTAAALHVDHTDQLQTPHQHDHDCENCLNHCHHTNAILERFAQIQPTSDAASIASEAKTHNSSAPPSNIERPKWDATTFESWRA